MVPGDRAKGFPFMAFSFDLAVVKPRKFLVTVMPALRGLE